MFRYREDRLPVLIIVFLFLLDVTVFFAIQNRWFIVAWFSFSVFPKMAISAWNHHHQHLSTFRNKYLNRALEFVYTLHTGMTTNVWILHHNLGHHVNYLDQTKDESRWKRKDGSKMGMIEYTLVTALTGYTRALQVARKHPRYQSGLFKMGVITLGFLGVLAYYNWFNTVFVFVLPMLGGYLTTCWHTYFHHAGLDTDDHFHASYNITHKWYNILTGNLGYHTAHHMKQGLHWSKLPEFHKEIEAQIPEHLYRLPSVPLRWLPSR
ncbi:MAG: fatty acid desaturase [Bdellovibrionales bacterium]|nr:fatty acid desaturase [Bdellovibrionales bacterium]